MATVEKIGQNPETPPLEAYPRTFRNRERVKLDKDCPESIAALPASRELLISLDQSQEKVTDITAWSGQQKIRVQVPSFPTIYMVEAKYLLRK